MPKLISTLVSKWKRNKTMEWLQNKTENEQTHLWNAARKVKK